MPKARDDRERGPSIPASVLAKRAQASAGGDSMDEGEGVDGGGGKSTGALHAGRKTEKDFMWENGGPGVYSCDYRKYYDLKVRKRMISRKKRDVEGHSLCVCVCVCVFFSSHLFWTSSSLDVPAGVTQEEGHKGFPIYLLSAVRAFIFLGRRIQPFLSLVDREVEFCVLTI